MVIGVLVVCLLLQVTTGFNHATVWRVQSPLENSYIIPVVNSVFRLNNNSVLDTTGFLRNKTIVFVGDSVTRYQYLYLIRYLDAGVWTDKWGQQLFYEKYYASWDDFFSGLSSVFGCNLMTDAPRGGEPPQGKENHYYYNGELNLTLSFHFWSVVTMHRTMPFPHPDDFDNFCKHFTTGHPAAAMLPRTANSGGASYEGAGQFLSEFIAPERPDMLIINHGLWHIHGGGDPMSLSADELKKFITTCVSAAKVAVWKVTTSQRPGTDEQHESEHLLEQMHSHGMKIYQTFNYTREIARDVPETRQSMWDTLHFTPFVYRELNIVLLEKMMVWFGSKDHHHDHHHHLNHSNH